jgi:hypothetical protein
MSGLHWLEADEQKARGPKKAAKAADEVLKDKLRLEQSAADQMQTRLTTLQTSLSNRLLGGHGSVTDFRRFVVGDLLRDVDAMIAGAQQGMANDSLQIIKQGAALGESHADEPLKAADLQMPIMGARVGLDPAIITATFENTVGLLSVPMQQFGQDVKVALRGVATAGDSKFGQIARLRDTIDGQGFDNAQYRAERIIRTELGRVFNEATYARLVALQQDFPFIRKGWRSTNDSRTRPSHSTAGAVYARGSSGVIPLSDMFRVGGALLRFPIDPLAAPSGRIAARETIMCRCNAFVDFDLREYGNFVRTRLYQIGGPDE